MPEENTKVVITNSVLSVEAAEPLPVISAEPLVVTGTIDANVVKQERNYDYRIFRSSNNFEGFYRIRAGFSFHNPLESLQMWFNEGWEIHYEGRPLPFAVNSAAGIIQDQIIVLRRPR